MLTLTYPRLPIVEARAAFETLAQVVTNLGASGQALHGAVVSGHLIDSTVVTDATGARRVANDIFAAFNAHLLEGTLAHYAADAVTAPMASAVATNTATTSTRLNEAKAQINAHCLARPPHRQISGAQIDTADGSDDATNIALANAVLDAWNRHCNSAAPSLALAAV